MRNNLITDPFFGQNEAELQWISDKNWTYKLIFNADQSIFSKGNIEILFHGLDTYADIHLNGEKIISEIKDEILNLVKSQNLIDIRTPSFLNAKLKLSKHSNLVEFNSKIKKIGLVENIFVEELNKHGADFICLQYDFDTTSPAGKVLMTIIMALAHYVESGIMRS